MRQTATQQRRVPEFFIIGQAKSGTTALYDMLRSHPQIYMPDLKEPHYFATDVQQYKGVATSDSYPRTFDGYLSLFSGAKPKQRIGEASVFYLWSRNAASCISDVQPRARIIAILREPASFLRSLHLQLVQGYVETENDFRKALSLEDARRRDHHFSSDWSQLLLYSDHVRYVDQLRRYYNVFPPECVLILVYDDFRRDNEGTVRTVLRFLDVDDTFPVEMTQANPSARVRSPYVDRLMHAVTVGQVPVTRAIKAVVKASTTRELRRRVLRATYRHVVYAPPRPPDERLMIELRQRFKSEVVALSKYLDRDLVALWGYDSIG